MATRMRIRPIREALGLTQRELAGRVGVAHTQVCKWESGRTFPSADKLPVLAAALCATIDELYECNPPTRAC